MKKNNIKFENGILFLCTKCFARLENRGHDMQELHSLRRYLKDELKASNHWGKFRVAESSCLGLCPASEFACYANKRSGEASEECWTVPLDTPKEVLLEKIREFYDLKG